MTADFEGGSILKDGGLAPLRTGQRRLGLVEARAGCIDPALAVRTVPTMLRLRRFAIA